jgi:hypothetical protein
MPENFATRMKIRKIGSWDEFYETVSVEIYG